MRIYRWITDHKLISFAAVLLITGAAILTLSYFGKNINTQIALETTGTQSVKGEYFAVRDELLLEQNAGGTVVTLAENGSAVAQGDPVALLFGDPAGAQAYSDASANRNELAVYKQLESLNFSSAPDMDKLDKEIDGIFSLYLDHVSGEDYAAASQMLSQLRSKLAAKEIAVGGRLDFSAAINRLEAALAAYESDEPVYKKLSVDSSGYFIGGADGFENNISYKNAPSAGPEDVRSALKSQAQNRGGDVYGRLVKEYKWYVLVCLDKQQAAQLKVDNMYSVKLENADEPLPFRLVSLNKGAEDEFAAVLQCNIMNRQVSAFRKGDIEIIYASKTGLKVNASAVRTLKNEATGKDEKGVYIDKNGVVRFRRIDIIFWGDGYVIAGLTDKNELKMYDQVIVSGRRLREGDIIG